MKFKGIIALLMISAAISLTGCGENKTSAVATDAEVLNLGNTNGNINNKGSLCADSENIYYQKIDDGYKIYKSDLNGNNETKLNDFSSYFINVYNDKVYYASEDDGFNIYCMNKDGSDNKKILESPANYMTIYKDNIYYSNADDNGYIYRASLDGTKNEVIFKNAAYFVTAYKDKLYFVNTSDNAKIYQSDLDGNNSKAIVEDYSCYINLYNDYVYYTTPPNPQTKQGGDYLHRYSLIDHTVDDLLNFACSDINITNDRIYYLNMDESKIYSCDLDGEDIKEVVGERGYYINIAGNKIYYLYPIDKSNVELREKELD